MTARWIVLAAGLPLTVPGAIQAQVMDDEVYTFVLLDQLEYRGAGAARPVGWELVSWIGGDFTRFWVKSEGERATVGDETGFEVQALYSKLIAPFWEFQFGARLDVVSAGGASEARVLAAIGFEGLAPYWFEMEPVLFVSQDGDISARLTTSYDVFVSQRLIFQPRLETNLAVQSVPAFGVGSGLTDVELGARMRYEIHRKAAPYVGVNWERLVGETATMARAAGDNASHLTALAGVRLWF